MTQDPREVARRELLRRRELISIKTLRRSRKLERGRERFESQPLILWQPESGFVCHGTFYTPRRKTET